MKDATLRQTLHMSVGAPKIKIAISNTFGGSDLPITAGSVGLPTGGAAGVSGMQASPLAAITVGGKTSFTVPRGQVVVSDEIDFEIKPQSMITVNLYSQQGQSGNSITGHIVLLHELRHTGPCRHPMRIVLTLVNPVNGLDNTAMRIRR